MAVGAVGLNFPDLLLCSGRYQEQPELPFSPGYEAAGTVTDVGDGSRWRPGQRVIVVPELPDGAMQEALTVPDDQLYAIPDDMPLATAAAFHIAYHTAHVALHRRAGISAGDTLLVTGGAGGVGSAAIQLGRAIGAQVIATAGESQKADACTRLGAHHVIDLSQEVDLRQEVRAATDGRGADVIVDVVGGDMFDTLRRCVAFEGRVVVIGFASGSIASAPTNHLLLRNYAVLGLNLASYRQQDPGLLQQTHDALVGLYSAGAIAPEIYRELPYEEAPAALELMGQRAVIGRVVLSVSNPA